MSGALAVTAELAAAMLDPVDVTGLVCDCGEAKIFAAEACDRCSFLDGVTFNAKMRQRVARPVGPFVIAALRVTARMSIRELAVEIYGSYTRSAHRSLLRNLQQLMAAGRVKRCWLESTTTDTFVKFGTHTSDGHHGFGAWAYELIGGGS